MRLALYSRLLALIAMLVAMAFASPPVPAHADELSPQLQSARAVLEKYQDPIVAIREGYFSTIACVGFTRGSTMFGRPYPAGGMGVHLLNMENVGTKLDPAKPQVLIYEPTADNKLKLAAAEWFVPYKKGMQTPTIFGTKFYGPMMGHWPIMPKQLVHYDLHVWLWKHNPAGMFVPTNPNVKCPTVGYNVFYSTPDMPAMP